MDLSPLESRRDNVVHVRESTRNGGVLIVDDEPDMRCFLERALGPQFARVETAANADEARALANSPWFHFLIADVRLPGSVSGRELALEFRDRCDVDFDLILMTGYPDVYGEISATNERSTDVLRKPFQAGELYAAVERARERRRALGAECRALDELHEKREVRPTLGESEPMREIWSTVQRIAPMPSTVLINGETGTGKEVVARALHDLSGRSGGYVPINCGAISADLIEGELFGHLKGAFTGAHQARDGLFAHAEGGTLFLDEIGEMPLSMQAKLLRVLEERRYRPVGGSQEIQVNTRVIAATHRDLPAEVQAGRFREDLFYRLNVIDLMLPPLRHRKSDIPSLAEHFLDTLSKDLSVPKPTFTAWDLDLLKTYHWPGNCRELRNVIERSLLLGKPIAHYVCASHASTSNDDSGTPEYNAVSLEDVQRTHILQAVDAAGGNKSLAARALGVSRKTVERKLKEWSVQ
ncbi:MAG: sigma-54 dependent transcriptional regulator [Thiohalocapsa sp.]